MLKYLKDFFKGTPRMTEEEEQEMIAYRQKRLKELADSPDFTGWANCSDIFSAFAPPEDRKGE
jgi:hypothetical protein